MLIFLPPVYMCGVFPVTWQAPFPFCEQFLPILPPEERNKTLVTSNSFAYYGGGKGKKHHLKSLLFEHLTPTIPRADTNFSSEFFYSRTDFADKERLLKVYIPGVRAHGANELFGSPDSRCNQHVRFWRKKLVRETMNIF